MCYSANVSLFALFLGLLGQYALWTRGDGQSKTLALALTCITIIQLYEYFMWKNPCTPSAPSSINKNVSRITMVTIISQPLIILGSLYWLTKNSIPNLPLLVGTFVYSFFAFIEIVRVWPLVTCSAPTGYAATGNECTKESCGLAWQFIDNISSYFWFAYVIIILWSINSYVKPSWPTAIATNAFLIGGFALSSALHAKQRSLASHWCIIAIALPWILFFLPSQ